MSRGDFFGAYSHHSQLATSVTVFLTSFAVAFILLPPAALVMLFGSTLIAATTLYQQRRIRQFGDIEQQLRSQLSRQIVDALGSLREVLVYGMIGNVVTRILATTDQTTATSRRRSALIALVAGIREALTTATVIGVIVTSAFAAGVLTVSSGDATLPLAMLPALIALTLAGVSAVSEAAATITELHPLAANARRVDLALRRTPIIAERPHRQPIPEGSLGLRFQNVSFTYNDHTLAVSNWSNEIRPGEHVGLAGPSGTGKSTIIALAARLWEPTSGTIELVTESGVRVSFLDVDDQALRQAVALVDQETTLFHGSVRDNLLRGIHPVPDADLSAILAQVGAAEWAQLDHTIGQGGLNLSGGQQARIALARALVRKPRILLIDEVTASLDPETERMVSKIIAEYPGTVLIASHRPETLNHAQRIIQVQSARAVTT